MSKSVPFMTIVALTAALAAPVAAQQKAKRSDAPSDARVKELIAQAQANLQQPAPDQKPIAGTSTGPRVDLTADEAVARALERNVTLASQRLTPRLSDFQIAATWATYRPSVTSTFINNSQTVLPNTTIEGGNIVNNDTSNWNAGLAQNVRWFGGNYTLSWTNDRQDTDRFNSTFNPAFNSGFRAQYTQPLLQNFKIDQHPHQPADTDDSARYRGARSAGDRRQHGRAGPQRVLGAGVRAAEPRGAERVVRSRHPAGQRQPRAGRNRHDGADRYRPGAGRTGDPPSDGRQCRSDAQEHRVGAEAPDRQRHRRSGCGRRRSMRRSVRARSPKRSTSKPPSARAREPHRSRLREEERSRPNTSPCRTSATRRCRSST